MTTLTNAITSLPAPSITLALGGLTTAYVFFANIGETQRGSIAYLNGRLTPVTLNDKERAKVWRGYFKPAATWIVSGSLISSALNITTSYLHKSHLISKITFVSGLASVWILPITFFVGLLPINSRLFELAEQDEGTANKIITPTSDDEAKKLIKTWEEKHLIRLPSYGVAWGLSFLAILLDGRV
ncbi:hypothetical protein I204_02059 [Kwoniella mangroviensis CBS 8886]|uniref:uncharacterized protein n=1 Tax=Kwoniella mangroviensis CBS 8507 TaxID=1296122 RepID=UPI00080D465F|nr:uncharacterized protein I203_03634 [Kwoniella mangroviensis CBS 8507]OCF66952.1 hypothetical protein I203_03634 [Kwoniella mangroviensis CBS 8507]OCF78053.1 hypothetical protein I204_02059 [Kwoniella mangroviensis CBS 8886]